MAAIIPLNGYSLLDGMAGRNDGKGGTSQSKTSASFLEKRTKVSRPTCIDRQWDRSTRASVAIDGKSKQKKQTIEDVASIEIEARIEKSAKRLIDEAVDAGEASWPCPRHRRGAEKLFASYDPTRSGNISPRDCHEALRKIGLSKNEYTEIVNTCVDPVSRRINYKQMTRPRSKQTKTIRYPQEYVTKKKQIAEDAAQVEKRLCAKMNHAANVASLRRRLKKADPANVGALAPCDFARALRDYLGEPLDEHDEIALCQAYDHRVPSLALIQGDHEDRNTEIIEPPPESPRNQRLDRRLDLEASTQVQRGAFVNRKGQESLWLRHCKSDEAMRGALSPNRQTKTAPSPVWDAVNYDRFLDNMEKAAASYAPGGSSYLRRRAVRKLEQCTDELERADEHKTLEATDALIQLRALGLTETEAKEALIMGSNLENRFSAPELARQTQQHVEQFSIEDKTHREAALDSACLRAETRHKGGGLGVSSAAAKIWVHSTTPSSHTNSNLNHAVADNTDRPMVVRSRFADASFINRRARHFADAIIPPPAGTRRKPLSAWVEEESFQKKEITFSGSHQQRDQRLTLERAIASVQRRVGRSGLAVGLGSLLEAEVRSNELQTALRRLGAPIAAADADRMILKSSNGHEKASRDRIAALLIETKYNDDSDFTLKHRSFPPRPASLRKALHDSETTVTADHVLRTAIEQLQRGPNRTFARSEECHQETHTPCRRRGSARPHNKFSWHWNQDQPAYKPLQKRSSSAPPPQRIFANGTRHAYNERRPLRDFLMDDAARSFAKARLIS